MLRTQMRILMILALLLFVSTVVVADAIVVTRAMAASTIAEIFIEESSVRVEVAIGPQDLAAFRNLMPDGLYERMGYPPKPL
ncbi:MAG: hypothetical protein O7G85_03625, partial [Planctomycetota bacterium]|nr:hypothetical protein [Planctomycetota bacterium]